MQQRTQVLLATMLCLLAVKAAPAGAQQDTRPPVIAQVSVTPDTLPPTGGVVTVTVQASDNVGVVKVLAARTLPDGRSTPAELKRVSGSAANGTWRTTWSLPENGSALPVESLVSVLAQDAAGNKAQAGPRTLVLSGAATLRAAKKAAPKRK